MLCEKLSLERSFCDIKEKVQPRADRGAAAPGRSVDAAGKTGSLPGSRNFAAELLSLAKRIRR
jgi:hypothetical protein